MKTFVNVIAIALILLSIVGCRKEETGGGSRGIVVGGIAREAVYGIRDRKELGFVMFTDLPSEGTSVSGGSTWTGQIKPTEGLTVSYGGSENGLEIDGTEYKFTDGRVFAVSTKGDTLSVDQLDVPIGGALYDAEIDRIVDLEEVQAFYAR